MFRNCLKAGYFPKVWNKANVVPVRKKGIKQILNNHRPDALLTICGKLFEEIMFDTIFQHLTEYNLLNPNHSGFMPGNSCIHQLISVTHEIYVSFDSNPLLEVTDVF